MGKSECSVSIQTQDNLPVNLNELECFGTLSGDYNKGSWKPYLCWVVEPTGQSHSESKTPWTSVQKIYQSQRLRELWVMTIWYRESQNISRHDAKASCSFVHSKDLLVTVYAQCLVFFNAVKYVFVLVSLPQEEGRVQ